MAEVEPIPLHLFVFEDAEVLDVMGPFEAFSLAEFDDGRAAFEVRLVADRSPVRLRGGLRVEATAPIPAVTAASVLLVPGGPGVRRLIDDAATIRWLATAAAEARLVLSVCTGAWLLGKAGLLDGLPVTTHHRTFARLAEIAPRAEIRQGTRFVDAGRIKTSAGVSAGIDLALHVIAELAGEESAARVRATMEWPDGG
jgi:transcriptional regulator GlxA family with amidase domain